MFIALVTQFSQRGIQQILNLIADDENRIELIKRENQFIFSKMCDNNYQDLLEYIASTHPEVFYDMIVTRRLQKYSFLASYFDFNICMLKQLDRIESNHYNLEIGQRQSKLLFKNFVDQLFHNVDDSSNAHTMKSR